MTKMGQVWDRTVEFLGDRLGVVLPVAIAGIFVPMSVLNGIGAIWVSSGYGMRATLTLFSVVLYLVIFWAYLTITAVTIEDARGPRPWGAALRRLPAGIGVYLLLAIGIFLLTMPIGVLAAMSGIDVAAMQRGVATVPTSAGMLWAAVIYFLAFLILLLVVAARLMPMTGVVYAERRGVGAIARSWRLTRGLTWRLIGVLLLYVVVMQVAAVAAQIVFGSILRLFAGPPTGLDMATIVTGIVVAAVQTGFSLLGAVFTAKLYASVITVPTAAAAPTASPWS